MKGMKRAASTGMKARGAKRAKTDKALAKAGSIADALKASDLPPVVVKTLRSIVSSCLSGYAGERHAFQETGLGMIDTALKSIEAAAVADVAKLQAQVNDRDAELARREAAISSAAREEASRIGAAAGKKADLTIIGSDIKHAEENLKTCSDAQKAGDAASVKLEGKLEKWDKTKKDLFAPAAEAALSKKQAADLDKALLKLGMDQSLVNSLATSSTKTPEERGEFDKVVLQNVEADIAAKMGELQAGIAAEAPGKAQRAAVKDKAQADYDAAKAKKDAAAAAVREAEKAVTAAGKDLSDAKEKVAHFAKEFKSIEASLAAATKKLEGLRTGPVALFATLKTRTAPPPPPEPVAEPAAEAAPATAE